MKKGKNKQDKLTWYERFWKKIPPRYEFLVSSGELGLLILLLYFGVTSYTRTLLPYSIKWLYYLITIFSVPLLISLWQKYVRKSDESLSNIYGVYYVKSVILFILILSILFVPNRYILLGDSVKCYGIVVDEDYIVYTKSSSSYSNLVKINLMTDHTSFWCDLNKKNKPIGSKCVVSVRRGIFGMRYVEDVDFIVE